MVEVKEYHLPPTSLIPNSPFPLLHYPGLLSSPTTSDTTSAATSLPPQISASSTHDLFTQNGWSTQWIFRYGPTQQSHYHSRTHECMAVLSGAASIRFGVADTDTDIDNDTISCSSTSLRQDHEPGGIILDAKAGDVFVIPAGVAHKTHRASPAADFKLLTPGDGHGINAERYEGDVRQALEAVQLDGFTMIGAYPKGGKWDFAVGGEDEGKFERVWGVERPERDPVLGVDERGLCGLWRGK